jgi:tetratricopeptide (TPR) repeat protein
MVPSPNSSVKFLMRGLRDPVWQGISGLAAIVALLAPLSVAAWELATGNVRVLLWLQATRWALAALVGMSLAVALAAAYVVLRRAPRFPPRVRAAAGSVGVLALGLALAVTAGYRVWAEQASKQTIVLIADFLDPQGQDSRDLTRELVKAISADLAGLGEIEVRALGWAIEDQRGEGQANARRIGELANADIVIWGDYRTDGEFVAYVHFDLLNGTQAILRNEAERVFGDEQVQAVAAQQTMGMPASYAFNVALGEHLNTLVVFAGGLTLVDKGDYTAAKNLLDVAVQSYGNPLAQGIEPALHHIRGTIYAALGDPATADQEYTAALATASGQAVLEESITPAMIYSNRGVARYLLGDPEAGMRDFDQAIELDPIYALAYYNRGLGRARLGDLAGALRDFDRAIEIEPAYFEAYVNRGNVRRDMGDPAGAMRDYGQAIEINPQHVIAYHNRGQARRALGDTLGAIHDYDLAIQLDPTYVVAYNNRGNARKERGDLVGAIHDYDLAIQLDPLYTIAYINRGTARSERGDTDGAIRDQDKAIELDPTAAAAYLNRGSARQQAGDLQGAQQDYDRAIALDPMFVAAYTNRGNARLELGDPVGAIQDYDKAIELNPQAAFAYLNRGNARSNLGDLAGALRDYDKAVELAPTFALAYYNRSIARSRVGDAAGAASDTQRYRELAPNAENPAAAAYWSETWEEGAQ